MVFYRELEDRLLLPAACYVKFGIREKREGARRR